MQVKHTKDAILAYVDDLNAREKSDEAAALTKLQGMFRGLLAQQMTEFVEFARSVNINDADAKTNELAVGNSLPALERLNILLRTVGTRGRRNDLQTFLEFLRRYESVKISALVNAVQSARRGRTRRPTMTIDELKARLDPALGDDARFKPIIAQLKLLGEKDFAEVAKTALEVPFRNKKEGLARLNKLHAITRTNRMKEAAANV